MELIIGGAFQGKTAFVKENYNISDEDIIVCEKESQTKFDKKCILHLEKFSYWCVEHGFEPSEYFYEHAENLFDKIIVCDDISCGVVPINKTERAWREANGRLLIKLSKDAEHVTRIFCGLSQRLK